MQEATGEIRLRDVFGAAPARPAEKPARHTPAADTAPTREAAKPAGRPSLEDSLTLDDEFTRFFTESVAVVPDEQEETERVSLWQRLRKGRAAKHDSSGDTVMLPSREEAMEATGEINLRGAVGEIKLKVAPQRVEAYSEEEDATRPIELDRDDREPDDHAGGRPRLFGSREPEDVDEEPVQNTEYETLEDGPAVQTKLGKRRGEPVAAGGPHRRAGGGAAVSGDVGQPDRGSGPGAHRPGPGAGGIPGGEPDFAAGGAGGEFPHPGQRPDRIGQKPEPGYPGHLCGAGRAGTAGRLPDRRQGLGPLRRDPVHGAAVLLLAFNAAGRRMMNGVISRNFQAVTSGLDREAAYLVHNRELTARLAAGTGEPDPALLISRPTELMRGFMRQSFSARPGDALARKLAWGQLAAGVVALIGGAVIGKSALTAVSSLAGTLCLAAPVCATLVSAVPSLMLQKSASRVGAVVPGWSAQEELGSANMILVGARDLFPAGCVRLHGIKTFEKERIDLAILYAASVLVKGCDTLRDVFLAIIQNKTEMLFPVENLTNEPGLGFTGWVQNNRVLVGNRELMRKHGVDTPSGIMRAATPAAAGNWSTWRCPGGCSACSWSATRPTPPPVGCCTGCMAGASRCWSRAMTSP